MTKLAIASLAAFAFVVPAAALACDHDKEQASASDCGDPKALQCNHQNQAQPETSDIERLTVAQVVQLKKTGKVQLVDVNLEKVRARYGVIPGALLLTSAGDFDAAKELPKNKDEKLVFYCLCPMCDASHMAAARAKAAGYTNVAVLQDGIRGWKEQGQALTSARHSTTAVPQS